MRMWKKRHCTIKRVKFCKDIALYDECLHYMVCMMNLLAYLLMHSMCVCVRMAERGFVLGVVCFFFPHLFVLFGFFFPESDI